MFFCDDYLIKIGLEYIKLSLFYLIRCKQGQIVFIDVQLVIQLLVGVQESVIKGIYLDETHSLVPCLLYIAFRISLLLEELVMNIFITVMKLFQLFLSLFACPFKLTRIDAILITEIPFYQGFILHWRKINLFLDAM